MAKLIYKFIENGEAGQTKDSLLFYNVNLPPYTNPKQFNYCLAFDGPTIWYALSDNILPLPSLPFEKGSNHTFLTWLSLLKTVSPRRQPLLCPLLYEIAYHFCLMHLSVCYYRNKVYKSTKGNGNVVVSAITNFLKNLMLNKRKPLSFPAQKEINEAKAT